MKACEVCTFMAELTFFGATCSKECARTKYLAQTQDWIIDEIRRLIRND